MVDLCSMVTWWSGIRLKRASLWLKMSGIRHVTLPLEYGTPMMSGIQMVTVFKTLLLVSKSVP